ncbi:MAG: ABC transporter ATP-binding protein [Treponema sp.]|jgi:oligopeptide/dipeptide ABC transporter ATP-binding protein|nr:ABC transporter ATP-binding protein [Treponema sp.]
MNQTPLLDVQGLSIGIQQGKRWLPAVDNISFQLYPGEILGIVGESGCGKTLTACSIQRLLPQGVQTTGGNILFNGIDITGLSQEELRRIRGNEIAMVFQEPMTSLNPLLTIGRQIGEPLELHGKKDKKLICSKVLEVMEKVGLQDPKKLAPAYPHQLSGGMRQRVMIAAAVICEPKLLIADEPTTALDVTIQAQILHLLKKINQELKTAILFISHDLGVISQLCDRVLVMYAGKLVEAGGVKAIFSHPQHEYTKSLIGSIPRKALKGKPLANIPGKVLSIEEIAERKFGCPFAPRCIRAGTSCFAGFPDKATVNEGHYVHCTLVKPLAEEHYGGI